MGSERSGSRSAVPPPLFNYAYLLLPADPDRTSEVVEADEDWSLGSLHPEAAEVVLWGRIPLRRVPPKAKVLKHVSARERSLRALRAKSPGRRRVAIHRLAPPPGRPGALGSRVRNYLLSGALVEVASDDVEVRLDAVVRAAGVRYETRELAPGSDRAATMRVVHPDGEAFLRMGATDSASDPGAAKAALEVLAASGIPRVPRALAGGTVSEVSYVVESIVPGARPKKVTEDLLHAVADLLARLPRSDQPPSALREYIERIAVEIPDSAPELIELRDALLPRIKSMPGILTHGDLWAGNVLVTKDGLGGVIDWDSWHPSGVPGTDLLHLHLSQARQEHRADLGSLWLEKPWRSERFTSIAGPYWSTLGFKPTAADLDAVGIAWWVGWLHHAITRHERLLTDTRWLDANLHSVLTRARQLI